MWLVFHKTKAGQVGLWLILSYGMSFIVVFSSEVPGRLQMCCNISPSFPGLGYIPTCCSDWNTSVCHVFFFIAKHAAYGNSWAGGRIRVAAAGLCQIQTMSVTYTTAHGNVGSLTHWARPGMEPAALWILVRFVTAEPQQQLLGEGCF